MAGAGAFRRPSCRQRRPPMLCASPELTAPCIAAPHQLSWHTVDACTKQPTPHPRHRQSRAKASEWRTDTVRGGLPSIGLPSIDGSVAACGGLPGLPLRWAAVVGLGHLRLLVLDCPPASAAQGMGALRRPAQVLSPRGCTTTQVSVAFGGCVCQLSGALVS
jgi:hypothetical protein